MKFKHVKCTPLVIALFVLAVICGICALQLDFFERLERMTYDLRVRTARHFLAPTATNLAFVTIDESSIKAVQNGSVGFRFGLYWPRQVYGRLVDELSQEGAKAAAFDVLFSDSRPDHPPVQMADGTLIESDNFFARQMQRAGDVILAAEPGTVPFDLFRTNALALGDILTEKDSDGILRRAKAFSIFRRWHPAFKQAEAELGIDLDGAKIEPGQIILSQNGATNIFKVPIDVNTNFDLADFDARRSGKARAFTDERIWNMGIVLAARTLELDLQHAEVDLPHGRIILRGVSQGESIKRIIPVDADGYFYINWWLAPDSPALTVAPVESLLWQDAQRLQGKTNELRDDFRDKLVVIGSTAQGNDLTDRGATPLQKDTFLVSKHWNIASSVITGQFIHRATPGETIVIITLLGLVTAFLTLQLRALSASVAVLLILAGYTVCTFVAFVEYRLWLPLIFPVLGAIIVEHISLVTYRVGFEEREQRHVKSVFSRIVSPNIVHELLRADKLSLGGARCEVSVFFADVRGFTAFTDQMQEQIAEYVRGHDIDLAAAEKFYEESARETLETVNLYLAAVADAVKKHNGTLDKYIGDCVMAFWNAPTPNEKHALAAIEAAVEAQRAISGLNEKRLAQNGAREVENRARLAAGQPPKPLHIALQLGTGINTGAVTVGLMGSDQHILNYTVFGREVNLASRLEGVSGSGRIIISDTTYGQVLRHAPALAATCAGLPPVTVKGIRSAVCIYEVPWQQNKSI